MTISYTFPVYPNLDSAKMKQWSGSYSLLLLDDHWPSDQQHLV